MEPPRYVLLETNYGTYTTYGVALVDCSDEYPIILETVSDLSQTKNVCAALHFSAQNLSFPLASLTKRYKTF